MTIEEIKQKYNIDRSIRDALSSCQEEISKLEEDENVKKYIRLKTHYETYKELEKLSDDTILDHIIEEDKDILEEDIYLCFGKDFLGRPKKVGGYYIESSINPTFTHYTIHVTKYVNLANPSDIVIIPSTEASDFEKEHQTIYHMTSNPEEEYRMIRRNLYRREITKSIPEHLKETSTYFCLGKYYRGDKTKEGKCIIRPKNTPCPYTRLSYYKNIDNPDDIVIIPTDESDVFEKDKKIIFSKTNDPEQEYEEYRNKQDVKKLELKRQ